VLLVRCNTTIRFLNKVTDVTAKHLRSLILQLGEDVDESGNGNGDEDLDVNHEEDDKATKLINTVKELPKLKHLTLHF